MARMATMNCPVCLTDFSYPAKQRDRKYCSHRCAFKFFGEKVFDAARTPEAREKMANSLRGRGNGDYYVKRGGRHEHRVAMEQKLGRALRSGEIVHHDDEVKKNNDHGNLILTDRVEHGRIHNLGKTRVPKTLCKFGHSLTSENILITSVGARRCLTCARSYDNQWKKNARAKRRQEEVR